MSRTMATVMCHRPRTQRLGIDSMPREIEVEACESLALAQDVLAKVRRAHRKMVAAGYPWPGGKFRAFQAQPNDKFYIRVGEVA